LKLILIINISKGSDEMADIIDYRIEGDDMQLVEVSWTPVKESGPRPER
jgi:hypothetical protein